MLSTFFPSTFTGLFTALVKEGLSIRTVNSKASKKGFLKSIGGGFAPAILNGPLGCGKIVYPFKMLTYSPASGEDMISWHALSLKLEGSNFTFTEVSIPSKFSQPLTCTLAVYKVKSLLATTGFALGSTLTGTFCPIFSILQL